MKKLLTLLVTSFTFLGVDAQNVTPSHATHRPQLKPATNSVVSLNPPPVAAKSTSFMDRWYNHTALVDIFNGNIMNYTLMPLWQDSTVLEVFVTGAYTINFSSMAEVFDPIHFTLWNDTVIFSSALMTVSDTDAYNVDSISFSGALTRGTGNRPPTIVDTFILSIAPSDLPKYVTDCTTDQWASSYITCQPGDDTLKATTILPADIDSVERTQLASNGAIVWKIPIVDSMRHDTAVVDHFTYEVPGGLQVPAGKGFAVTVTFKSGDTWTPNVDTFSTYHNFAGLTGEAIGTGQVMPYYYNTHDDRGMSNSMFAVTPSGYYPSVFIEGWNTVAYKYEFHDISAHIGCNNCLTIAARHAASVEDVNALQINVTAYPNPASDEVNISFNLDGNADATVSINNALGQLIATQDVKAHKNTTVTFSTTNMAAGMYFYTIEVNGQRKTDRFVVAH